jgi:hypothetical protein
MSVAGTSLAKYKEYQARTMDAKSVSEHPGVCKNIWIFHDIFIK